MRRLLYSIFALFFSITVYGSSDKLFRFITSVPKGDTDVSSVNIERIDSNNTVILDKTLEIYRSDRDFVYYNLFYPEIASNSTLVINKARIRVPKSFRFRHGRHGQGGITFFCFGNQKEWFLALFNVSSDEDSSGLDLYTEEEIPEEKWARYYNVSKDVMFNEVHSRHPERELSRSSIIPSKNSINGFRKIKKNVLFFSTKNQHKNRGIEALSSFEIIDKRTVITLSLNNDEGRVLFCIPGSYYESATETHGHGIMIGYDLVGSETHIVYSRMYNAELEIENWIADQKIITDSKIVRKGLREGMYWRSDAFLKESGGTVFTLYGYGKDSLEINHILDSAHFEQEKGKAVDTKNN